MKILGIDLGNQSVKAVEIHSAFGRFEVHEYYEQAILPDQDPMNAVQTLIQNLPHAPDRIAIALRNQQSTYRNLLLPTRDKKAVQANVGFELEDDLPFSIEDTVYDYSILSQTSQTSQVYIAATLKTHLETILRQWNQAQADPDWVTTEAWAYRTLLNRIFAQAQGQTQSQLTQDPTSSSLSLDSSKGPLLLLQIGHERSTLYVHSRGMPVLIRDILWGGKDFTQCIEKKYGISKEEAEKTKLDHGFVIPPSQRNEANAEQIEFSDVLEPLLKDLIFEIRQVELSNKTLTHEKLSGIFLAGGTSLLPGLSRWLSEELQIPVRQLRSLSALTSSQISYSEQTDAGFGLAAGLALCWVGPDRTSGIQFRKGPFAKHGKSKEWNWNLYKKPILSCAAIAASIFVSVIVQNFMFHQQIEKIDSQLEKSVRSFFGQVSNSAVRNYMSDPSALKKSIHKELQNLRDQSQLFEPNRTSPIRFLREISSSLPKDAVLDVTQLQIDTLNPHVSLTFLVSNPQIVEKVALVIQSKVNDLERSKVEEVTAQEGAPPRWKMTLNGKPTEDSYGK